MIGAQKILHTLESHGYEAYIVGGAVRDLLCGKSPKDIDIVTNAHPDEVITLAQSEDITCSDIVGKKFGVVILTVDGEHYEVATFRKERYGKDAHRPEEIIYADTLAEDVQRRDFTINGMAMDKNGKLYDFVGGEKDLKKKLIRTIGQPQERFSEDALRMFRACRFASQMNFWLTKECFAGIKASLHRVSGLAQRRILIEIEKILLSPYPARGFDTLVQSGLGDCYCTVSEKGNNTLVTILPELTHLVGLPQTKAFHAFDGWNHTLAVMQASPVDLTLRWAALLHDVAKGLPGIRGEKNGKLTDYGHDDKGAVMTREVLTRFGYAQHFVERVTWLVKNHMRFHFYVQTAEANALKWLRQEAQQSNFRKTSELVEGFAQLSQVCKADVIGCGREIYSTDGTTSFGAYMVEEAQKMPVHTRDLHYGPELVAHCRENTGEILRYLLKRVQDRSLENTEIALLEGAKQRLKRLEINGKGL